MLSTRGFKKYVQVGGLEIFDLLSVEPVWNGRSDMK